MYTVVYEVDVSQIPIRSNNFACMQAHAPTINCVYTHTHTHIHTHTHTHAHTHTQHTYKYIHMRSHMFYFACMHAGTRTKLLI